MEIISNQELMNIHGGQIAWGIVGLVLAGIVAFAVGILDGFKRPLRCNK